MERTWKPVTGAIVTIIAGATAVASGAIYILMYGTFWQPGGFLLEILGEVPGEGPDLFITTIFRFLQIYGLVFTVAGIASIILGIFTLKKWYWKQALTGAIFACVSNPYIGILAIIFVIMGKDEFIRH